ncbi:uncharacterized protein LOC135156113 [Lytechinus pictus]|uniref:uncharacterized protein LOC135156113 n=1 Tax=Lytechinus pictus TaxID=7653 RepID=UPI0030B9B3EF
MEPCHQRDESQDVSNGHTQTQEVPYEDTLSTSHCSQSVATKNSQGENQTHTDKSKDTWRSSALKLPATSSVGHNNVESYAPRNAPYAQYIKQHLPKEPSVTVHSNHVVIVPAEEYHQLLEMVKQNRKDIIDLKARIGNTLQSSKNGSALSSRECHQKTKGPASETKSCASEIQAPMSSTTSSWDGQDQIQEYPKEIEAYKKEIEGYKTEIQEYKKEIKDLKDWKQFVIKTLCGTQEVEQQIACTDIQEIDVGQQAEIQGQTTKLPKCGTSMTSNAKSHGDTNVPVLDDQDCCELEEYATAIEEDDDKSVTGLQTSSMKDEDMSEEEVTDFGEYENDVEEPGPCSKSIDQSLNGCKTILSHREHDTNVAVLDDQDCCQLEEFVTAIEEDDQSVTGLHTSSMKDEDMSEEEVTDFGENENVVEEPGPCSKSGDQSPSGRKTILSPLEHSADRSDVIVKDKPLPPTV